MSCVFLESFNAYSKNVSTQLKRNFWQTPPNTDYSLSLKSLVNVSDLYNGFLKQIVEKNSFLFCQLNKFLEPTEKKACSFERIYFSRKGHVAMCINSKKLKLQKD